MHTRVAVTLALCLAAACGGDRPAVDASVDGSVDAPPIDAGPTEPLDIRIATWNVENFFDNVNDPETFDDVASTSEMLRKVEDVGRVLRALDADVVVLQEVENIDLLDRLADGPLDGLGYDDRVLVDSFDPRGINVGVMSRYGVGNVASHTGEPFPAADGSRTYGWARDALEIFISPKGHDILIMTVHFRSMRDGAEAAAHRLAEALQARRIVDRRVEFGQEHIIVAGDFNDVPGSATLDALLDGETLDDVTLAVPSADRWSFVFSGERRQLDYILASPSMSAGASDVRFLHGAEVDSTSDHSPAVATFHLEP